MEINTMKLSVKDILINKFYHDDLWDLLCHNAFKYLLEKENCTEISREDYVRICSGADFLIRTYQVTTSEECKDLDAILECFNDTDIMRESEHPKVIASFRFNGDEVILFQYNDDDFSLYWYHEDFSKRGTLVECANKLGMYILEGVIPPKVDKEGII